jgi:hypothetical protein
MQLPATVTEQSREEAYCRQSSGTVTPGIGPRWGPWLYICWMSRPLCFFFPFPSLILLIDKGEGVGLFFPLVFPYYTLVQARLHYSYNDYILNSIH